MNTGLTLTHDMMLVLGLVVFTVLMLVLEWIRADLVALLIIVVIGITRLMPVEQLFDGFAGNAVISLLGVMIMGAGLDRRPGSRSFGRSFSPATRRPST